MTVILTSLWRWITVTVEEIGLACCLEFVFFFYTNCVSRHNYIPREPRRDPSNRELYEHGLCMICILHCQESNSLVVFGRCAILEEWIINNFFLRWSLTWMISRLSIIISNGHVIGAVIQWWLREQADVPICYNLDSIFRISIIRRKRPKLDTWEMLFRISIVRMILFISILYLIRSSDSRLVSENHENGECYYLRLWSMIKNIEKLSAIV